MGYIRNLATAARVGAAAVMGRSPIQAMQSAYRASSNGRRMASFNVSRQGPNALIIANGEVLRARSRALVLNNPWASNAIDSFVSNAVGTGIKPDPRHPDKTIRKNLTNLWRRWDDYADSYGLTDFYGLQATAARECMEAGECLARLRPRMPQDGLPVPLQIQLIEPEQLPWWKCDGGVGTNIVRGGIEFDALMRRVAYHMYKLHPGDSLVWPNALEILRIPAASVMHVFRPLRASQQRGQVWFAQTIVKLYELEQYDDAELVRKKLATMFLGWWEKIDTSDLGLSNTSTTLPNGGPDAPDGTVYANIQPGTILTPEAGSKLEFNKPPDVGTMYEQFMRVQLRAIAVGLGITYEQLSGDLSGVNYSSIRAGLLEFRRRCEQFQFQVLVYQFCRPTWKAFCDQAALAGKISIEDYARNTDLYLDVEWRTPKWAWVNPLDDVKAEKEMVRCGFKPRSTTIHEMGEDPEEVDAQIKSDNDRADGYEFVLDSDPRKTNDKGALDTKGAGPDSEAEPVTNSAGSGGASK